MALTPFHRAPGLSSKAVLVRMDTKRRLFARRREELKREIASLEARAVHPAGKERDRERTSTPGASEVSKGGLPHGLEDRLHDLHVEDRLISGWESELEAMFRLECKKDEIRKAKAAARSRQADAAENTAEASIDRLKDPGSEASATKHEIRSAGAGRSAERHNEGLCLFVGIDQPVGSDPTPQRVDPGVAWLKDPLMGRLLRLIEVPGLLHQIVLAESAQRVIDVATVDVPSTCLGLPSAPAFAGHVFSARAFSEVRDPVRCEMFLLRTRGAAPRPPA